MDRAGAIKQFVVDQYLADATVSQLGDDYDLIANGVIDSLGLLRLIRWLEESFEISVGEVDIAPNDFRTVRAIDQFVAKVQRVASAGHQ